MVNWHDPVLLKNDHFAFIKLNHAIAGLYFWETAFTVGFELGVLRRKRPYRWTIWLYLGTRYTLLLAFICLLIAMNSSKVPCKPLIKTILALMYVSWAFASFTIVLRVIAIWNHNIIVSLIAVGVLLSGLALNIRRLALIPIKYNAALNTCISQHPDRALVNCIGVLVADVVLLLTMLIGLLRHANKNSTGICKLLYQQCIIWLALASIAEIPPTVFLILNLNGVVFFLYASAAWTEADDTLYNLTDVWNQMLLEAAVALLSIGAARMYRSLSEQGSFTDYVSVDVPESSSGTSNSTVQRRGVKVSGPIHFASVTQSEGAQTTYQSPAFLPGRGDHMQLACIPDRSISSLVHNDTNDEADSARYETV